MSRHDSLTKIMPKVDYSITRKDAAESLKVAERTVDRYIRSGTLSSAKREGRIWLSKAEIQERLHLMKSLRSHRGLKDGKIDAYTQSRQMSRHQSRQKVSIDTPDDQGVYPTETSAPAEAQYSKFSEEKFVDGFVKEAAGETTQDAQTPVEPDFSTPQPTPKIYPPFQLSPTERIYQKLYEKLLKKHENQQERLEGANYKVGELEAKLASSVPLLEYQKETARFRQLESGLKQKQQEKEQEIGGLLKDVHKEKLNRYAYIVLLFIILALQPVLWIFLQKP